MPAAKDLTEMFDIDPERVDGVRQPASGLPILLMKALSTDEIIPATPAASATDASKETLVPEVPAVTETSATPPESQESKPVEKSLTELVKEEVAKAVTPLTERNKALEDEMAALKSLPIPGGPAITAPAAQRSANERVSAAADVARFERLAKSISGNAELTRYYEEKAAEARKAANG